MTTIPLNDTESNSTADENPKRPKLKERPYVETSWEDMNWLITQRPYVQRLWIECSIAKASGGAEDTLKSNLRFDEFQKAKKILEKRGLFYPLMQEPPKKRGFQKSV